MVSADDFLQTCNVTFVLSGHVSTIILMRECHSNYSRARNFLSNSLVPLDKYNMYFACPNHKTTCPKICNHNNTKG